MSGNGNYMDIGAMENFFGRLKFEMFYGEKFQSVNTFIDELRKHVMAEHHFQLQCSGDLLHGLCEECTKNSDL